MVTDKLDIDADWWFHSSNIRFKGKLIFSEDTGGKLTICGSEEPFMALEISQNQTKEIKMESNEPEKICKQERQDNLIFGKTKDGKKITILYSLPPNTNSVRRENYTYHENTYSIDFIFIGTHFENINEIKFESIIIEYSNLPYWIHDHELTGFNGIAPDSTEKKYIFEHKYGKTVDVDIDNLCLIQFFVYPEINIDLVTANKISEHPYTKISSKRSKTLDDYIILKNILQDFFNFATTNEVRTGNDWPSQSNVR